MPCLVNCFEIDFAFVLKSINAQSVSRPFVNFPSFITFRDTKEERKLI